MDIHDLRAELRSVVEEMEALDATATDEDRDLTDDEQADYDEMEERARKLERRISRLQAARERRDRLGELDPAADSERRGQRERGRITEVRDYDASDFRSIGEFVHAVVYNPRDQRLRGLEHEVRQDDLAMGTGVHDATNGPLGGFAVPEQFRADLLEVPQQGAIVRPRAMVIPAGTPPDAPIYMPALDQSTNNNRYGGVAVSWIDEAGEKPQTDLNLQQISLQPHEVAGHIVISDRLLRNWQAADAVIRRLLSGATISAEETAFITGNADGKPQGIVGSTAEYTVNRAVANQISYADVAAMYARMLMTGGGTPVWIASQSVLPQLLTMADASNRLLFQPGIREGVQPQLLGFPVLWNERSPALGTKGDLIFANLDYYIIKDGSGPFVAASEHVNFINNQTVIKVFNMVDGKPWPANTFLLENNFEVSPFVVLDVPAGDGDGDGDAGDA